MMQLLGHGTKISFKVASPNDVFVDKKVLTYDKPNSAFEGLKKY